jgi:hypothetical protein
MLLQVLPQAPQFSRSVDGSTQVPLHETWPVPQAAVHLPAWQVLPAPHAVPQAPQLLPSVASTVHVLLHSTCAPVQPLLPG